MFGQGCLGFADAKKGAANKHELGNTDLFGANLSLKFKTRLFFL